MHQSALTTITVFVLIVGCKIKGSLGLRIIDIIVPEVAKVGDDVKLICNYNLDGDSLYALKWHFNNNEFFRYTPRDTPKKQIFPLSVLDADLKESTNDTAIIRRVRFTATGKYKCEVSAEYSFQTVSREKLMLVTVNRSSTVTPINRWLYAFSLILIYLISTCVALHCNLNIFHRNYSSIFSPKSDIFPVNNH